MASWKTTNIPNARLGFAVLPLRVRMITVMEPAARLVTTLESINRPKSSTKPETTLPAMTTAVKM